MRIASNIVFPDYALDDVVAATDSFPLSADKGNSGVQLRYTRPSPHFIRPSIQYVQSIRFRDRSVPGVIAHVSPRTAPARFFDERAAFYSVLDDEGFVRAQSDSGIIYVKETWKRSSLDEALASVCAAVEAAVDVWRA